MAIRPIISTPLAPKISAGGFLTYAPVTVPAGAAAGASAGQLTSPLTGAVFSILSGNLSVNASTGTLTTTATAPSNGSISAHVRVQDATNASAEELTISVPLAGVASAPTIVTAPTLSANAPVVGVAITATPGTYTGSPTLTRNWSYADTGTVIFGASGLSYTPISADVGHTLKYTEIATNATGSVQQSVSTTSAVTAAASTVVTADNATVTADNSSITADS